MTDQPPPPPWEGYGSPSYRSVEGVPAGAQPVAAQNSGTAIAVLVLGIASLALLFMYCIGFVAAIVALVIAPRAKREIRESGGRLTGAGLITAGVICSWVSVGLTALAAGVVALFVLGGVGGLS